MTESTEPLKPFTGPFAFSVSGMVTPTNYYGVLLDLRNGVAPVEVQPGGESLAAKIMFKDRTIRVGWDGSISVEPME